MVDRVSGINEWDLIMKDTLNELFRILNEKGMIAFEVGEVRNGSINLDENICSLAIEVGFKIERVIINDQSFTKTSNLCFISSEDYF